MMKHSGRHSRPRQHSRPGRLIAAAAALAAVALMITMIGQSAASPGPSPAKSAAARAELSRLIKQGLLAPGRRANVQSNVHRAATRANGLNQVSYYNWSGYADDNLAGNTYTKVAGTWTEPTVTCPSKEDAVVVFWVGLDGFNTSTVEQDGTLAQCYLGTAFYYTWWEMYPSNQIQTVGTSVLPGDHITALVNFSGGKYTLTLTDSTTPANSFSTSQSCGSGLVCANSSAEWIAETPSYARGYSPLPRFTSWRVSAAKATSKGVSSPISAFSDDQITIVGEFGENLATTGPLNATGNGFTDTWAYIW